MHKPVLTATSSTLYPKNFFIQIACYRRSSQDSRGIFDSWRSVQVEFILLNISHITFRHCRERSYLSFGQPFPISCKWVPANLMLGVTLRWTSISSTGSRNTPSRFMLQTRPGGHNWLVYADFTFT